MGRQILFILCLAFAPIVGAEDPFWLGFKGAAALGKPVPEDIARQVTETATAHLAPYLKSSADHYSCSPLAGTRKWMNLQGLRFSSIYYDALSKADQANGIEARLKVSIMVDSYCFLETNGVWGKWMNGRPYHIPAMIWVAKRNGAWTASSNINSFLRPVSDRPLTIPSETSALPKLKVPPTAAPPRTAPALRPRPPATQSRPAGGSSPKQPTPAPVRGPSVSPFLLLGGGAALAVILPLCIRRAKRKRPTPPPLPPTDTPGWMSPGTSRNPQATATPTGNPTYLARTFLHTRTEQIFHRRLQSLIDPSCSISGKVRLADLFEAPKGRDHQTAFNRICSKHIDFVIIDQASSRILCAIELDDASHQRPDRQERDRFVDKLFASAPFDLLRVPVSSMHDADSLKRSLRSRNIPLTEAAYMPPQVLHAS